MEDSRLKENLKKRAYHNVLLASFGIVAVLLIILLFGTQLLVGFSLLLGKITGSDEQVNSQQVQIDYIAPPRLDIPTDATNSATLTLTGSGTAGHTVMLYRNDRFVDEARVSDDESFTFRSVTLQSGENVFKANSSDENNESAFSNQVSVTYLSDAPSLTIESPHDGQTFKKDAGPVKIQGETDRGATVTVNDFRAIVNSRGTYTYSYTLTDGDNRIKVVATDAAGNETTEEISIKAE